MFSFVLQVNYFNEIHAAWEPLIERVVDGHRRWKLSLEVSFLCAFAPDK